MERRFTHVPSLSFNFSLRVSSPAVSCWLVETKQRNETHKIVPHLYYCCTACRYADHPLSLITSLSQAAITPREPSLPSNCTGRLAGLGSILDLSDFPRAPPPSHTHSSRLAWSLRVKDNTNSQGTHRAPAEGEKSSSPALSPACTHLIHQVSKQRSRPERDTEFKPPFRTGQRW